MTFIPPLSQTWSAQTVLTLCNVPWDAGYRNWCRFESAQARDAWIADHSGVRTTFTGLTTVRPGEPVVIAATYEEVLTRSYVQIHNGSQIDGAPAHDYFYFITAVEYVAPMSTRVVLQLDVLQTFGYDVVVGQSFVERGHVAIANSNVDPADPLTWRRYLTVPEGLDTGDKLIVNNIEFHPLFGDAGVSVVAYTTVDLSADPGTVDAPKQESARPTMMPDGMASGGMYCAFTQEQWYAFLSAAAPYPWITRNISSATMMPTQLLANGTSHSTHAAMGSVDYMEVFGFQEDTLSIELINRINVLYPNLHKLKTFPYSCIELMTDNGQPLQLKPQLLQDPVLNVDVWGMAVQPFTRVGYTCHAYAQVGAHSIEYSGLSHSLIDYGEDLDQSLFVDGTVNLPVVNDGSTLALSQSAYTRAYNYESASWNQQMGVAAARNDRTNNYASTANALENATTSRDLGLDQRFLGAASNLASGTVGGAIGGPAGMATGLAMSALSTGSNLAAAGMSAAAQTETMNRNAALGYGTSDRNYSLAVTRAEGDYQLAQSAIQASIQQAELTPPSSSSVAGGAGANVAYGLCGLRVRWRTMEPGVLTRVADYFMRWGYAINEWMLPPADLQAMNKFTYWKFSEAVLVDAPIPEFAKIVVRSILEQGVTVWSDPDDIGRTNLVDNVPLTGVSY